MMPAKVRYIGSESEMQEEFTVGRVYDAFFVEYWQGIRDSLHVRNDEGIIEDFVPFGDFEVLSDPDGLLEMKEAIVRCVTRRFDDDIFGIHFGKEYVAIGRDKNGMYLVKDESGDCYFYNPEDFEIVSDPDGILSLQSVYYSYFNREQLAGCALKIEGENGHASTT